MLSSPLGRDFVTSLLSDMAVKLGEPIRSGQGQIAICVNNNYGSVFAIPCIKWSSKSKTYVISLFLERHSSCSIWRLEHFFCENTLISYDVEEYILESHVQK